MIGWNIPTRGTTWGASSLFDEPPPPPPPGPYRGGTNIFGLPARYGTPNPNYTGSPNYDPNDPSTYASPIYEPNDPGSSYWAGTSVYKPKNLLFGYNKNALGPSGKDYKQSTSFVRDMSPYIAQLKQFSSIDPNSIFSNYYQGLKAMGSIGIESNKQYQLAKRKLEDRLRNSQSGLMGDLSGIEEARLFNILNQDKALYGTNTAEIQRMKEFVLYALQNANQQRDEARGYLGDQKGFVAEALRQALDRSQDERVDAANTLENNLFEVGSSFAGRGSGIGRGRFMADKAQQDQYSAVTKALADRDEASRLDRDKAMRDIQSQLEKLDLGQKMDELKAREDLAGYDSERARLDANQNKIGYNFMAAVAKLRAEEKARKDQDQLMRFYSGLEQQRIQREAAEAQQRANQQAFFGAIAQQQQADQNLYNAYSSIGEANGRKMLRDLLRKGDTQEFNKLKLWGRRLGWW